MKQEDKIRKYRLGSAKIPLLLMLLLLAIAVPVATKLVQQRQETRRGATGDIYTCARYTYTDDSCSVGEVKVGNSWTTTSSTESRDCFLQEGNTIYNKVVCTKLGPCGGIGEACCSTNGQNTSGCNVGGCDSSNTCKCFQVGGVCDSPGDCCSNVCGTDGKCATEVVVPPAGEPEVPPAGEPEVPPAVVSTCDYGPCGGSNCGSGKRWVSGSGCPSWYTGPGCYTDLAGCGTGGGEDAKFNGTVTSWDGGMKRWSNGAVNCAGAKGVILTTTSGVVQWYTDHFDVINNPQGQQQTVTLTLPASCGYACGTWNVIDRGANLTGNTVVKTGTGCVATFTPQNTDWRSAVTWDIIKKATTTRYNKGTCNTVTGDYNCTAVTTGGEFATLAGCQGASGCDPTAAPTCRGLTLNGQSGNITVAVGATVTLASTVSNYGLISSAKVISLSGRVADTTATNLVHYTAGTGNLTGKFVGTQVGIYAFEVNAYESSSCNYLCSSGATLYKSSAPNKCLVSGIWDSVGNCSSTGCIHYVTVVAAATKYTPGTCSKVTGNYTCTVSATGAFETREACETSSGCDVKYAAVAGSCNTTTGDYTCAPSAIGTFSTEALCKVSTGCDVATTKYNRGTCNTGTGRYACTTSTTGTYTTLALCENSSGCDVKYAAVTGSCNTTTGDWTCAPSATGTFNTDALCKASTGCDIASSTDLVLKYRMAFAGLKPGAKCAVDWTTNLIVKGGTQEKTYGGLVAVKTTEVNSNGDMIYKVEKGLTGFTQKTAVAAFIKGIKHLQMKYGKNSQTGTYGKAGGELTLKTVDETGHTVYDFTGYPLLAGDVDQNGVINAIDFTMVKAKASTYAQVDEGGYLLEDLDGSCQVNTADITLLVKSLDEKQAELY